MIADAGWSAKDIAKARARCRKWMARVSNHLSPLNGYVAVPGTDEPMGYIALNGGVQAGANPFGLRQSLREYTGLADEAMTIHFSPHLPFALVCPSGNVKTLTPLVTESFTIEVPNEPVAVSVYMLHVANLWSGGSSPNTGPSLLYLLYCKASAVLDACRHVFQLPTTGAEKFLHVNNAQRLMNGGSACRELMCEPVVEVPGLFVVEDFITSAEHDLIWQELKGSGASTLEVENLARRRVAHFNRRFYYGVNKLGGEGDSVNPKPTFYDWMQQRLRNADDAVHIEGLPAAVQATVCDQLTVNFYDYDSDGAAAPGIAHHVDAHSPFGECVLIVSLGSHTVIEFCRHETQPVVVQPIGVFAAPRSLLLMTGDARYAWTHCIAERRVDMVTDSMPPLRRGDRVSLTWRRGREGPHRRSDCICKELCDGE
ncbi:oxidoreductase [Trypanosoma grayi]|uniref:oxidoreductase n=1 Tax=Trypanosoma grayi TaxID=71804 RepID=UPI0004F472A9|nr:oxidoreductase [Trypanosoma grayi]KEG12277.1 oxidoreductase [Trypanosoma grayi]